MALSERCVIANMKFVYQREPEHLRGKLKYFQHRDDRDTHVRQHDEHGQPIRRWADRGLGDNYHSIARNCDRLATSGLKNEVAARTMVLSPQVEFMAAIPAERRMAVMAELTDTTVTRWFEEMGLPQAEYAFVLHKGDVKTDRPDGVGQSNREFVHSHVILAATTPGLLQDRDNYKVYREQLDDLHQVSVAEMERIWTRELGRDRVQALNEDLEELTAALTQIDLEKSQVIAPEQERSPHEVDESLLTVYEAMDVDPPDDLLASVYDARQQASPEKSVIDVGRELGLPIPHEKSVIEVGRELGLPIPYEKSVIDMGRDLGLPIPYEKSVIDVGRDLGLDLPYEKSVIEVARDLGFDIPIEGEGDIDLDEPAMEPDVPEIDLD